MYDNDSDDGLDGIYDDDGESVEDKVKEDDASSNSEEEFYQLGKTSGSKLLDK